MKKFLKMAMAAILFAGLLIAGCIDSDKDDPKVKEPQIQGKLLILQAYGSSSNAAGVSHSFVELYNISDEVINLDGISLYYADGTSANANGTSGGEIKDVDADWKMISLDGKTIPAKGSFLILGPMQSATAARLKLADNYGDINNNEFTLNNRAFKAALIKSTGQLTVQNPFDSGNGKPVSGYIDMVGAANTYPATDMIKGYEGTAPARCSASEAVRRKDLLDTDDNSADFIAARYASTTSSSSNAVPFTKEMLEVRKPRNSSAGSWNPFAEPVAPVPSDKLLIFQIGAATDGNINRSFIELYNASSTEVNLTGYSIQHADGTRIVTAGDTPATTDGEWNVIDLTGKTIQPHHSFLILGEAQTTGASDSPPALAFENGYGDMNLAGFNLSNRSVKVVLIQSTAKLTVQNPFNIDGNGTKSTGYIDMISTTNDASASRPDQILGYETAALNGVTKQVGARRKSLADSDNNSVDFEIIRYADHVTKSGGTITEYKPAYEIYRPKNHTYGAWNPITGVKE